jgi:AcrR family transcriptional regulator
VLSLSSELFRQNGYEATSMRDIAAACGMKSGSLYYYYESKEALLAAILSVTIDEVRAELEATIARLPKGASVRSKFRAALKTSVKIIVDSGDMAIASTRTLSLLNEPGYSEQVRHRKEFNQFWRNLIIEGKERGEIKPSVSDAFASMIMIGAMSYVPEWFDPKRSTTDEVAEYLTNLLFDGMTTAKRRTQPAKKT